jgi:hypothetical protein
MEYNIDEWEEHFKPIINHLDPQASWQTDEGHGTGLMFETYGEELEFVLGQPEEKVWSYMDDEEDNLILCAGRQDSNKVIGYLVTEVAREPELEDSSNHICITLVPAEERL